MPSEIIIVSDSDDEIQLPRAARVLSLNGNGVRRRRIGSAALVEQVIEISDSDSDQDIITPSVHVKSEAQSKSRFTKLQKGKGKALHPSTATPPPAAASTCSTFPIQDLSTLVCPICLGPPNPMVVTECGHYFCGPCLHESLIAAKSTPPPPELGVGLGDPFFDLYNFNFRAEGSRAGMNAMELVRRLGGGARLRAARGGRGGARGLGRADPRNFSGQLDKRCPVCRVMLTGGWGQSLRGYTIKYAAVEG